MFDKSVFEKQINNDVILDTNDPGKYCMYTIDQINSHLNSLVRQNKNLRSILKETKESSFRKQSGEKN